MVSNHHFTRIDTMELKNQIFQKIGQQRGEKYFDHLKKWFSSKICKVEFDKVCVQTIGKENVALHNLLIKSIIKNACTSTTSPKIRKVPNGSSNQRTCLQPQSPHKNRTSVVRNRKCTNRPSPLGPFGKSPSIITEDVTIKAHEQQSAGEEVDQLANTDSPSVQSQVLVTAPFGVSINLGSTRRSLWNQPHYGSHEYLPDTPSLRERLEKRLEREGVGISLDTANLINHGLDVYMKRLIESSIGIARSHTLHPQRPTSIGILDFRVAMETNPRILGEDWPFMLEKLCFRTSEQ